MIISGQWTIRHKSRYKAVKLHITIFSTVWKKGPQTFITFLEESQWHPKFYQLQEMKNTLKPMRIRRRPVCLPPSTTRRVIKSRTFFLGSIEETRIGRLQIMHITSITVNSYTNRVWTSDKDQSPVTLLLISLNQS